MPEYRRDPLSDRWVVLAEDRAGRPSEYSVQPARHAMDACPFCAGHESATPHAVATFPESEGSAWQVRVIPNKYPAARLDPDRGEAPPDEPAPRERSKLFERRDGLGVHEVIIEAPQHVASFSQLSDEQIRWSVRAYQSRLAALRQHPEIAYGLVFKNCRGGGGATLEHSHSQLLATGIVPHEVERELRTSAAHFDAEGRCLLCDLVQAEIAAEARIVARTGNFTIYCPYAGRFPYETWIVPNRHGSDFDRCSQDEQEELGLLIQRQVLALERCFPDAAYNFWIQTAPFTGDGRSFHWRVQVIPRVTTQAGYEWGSGCFVNSLAPESAAAELRRLWSA